MESTTSIYKQSIFENNLEKIHESITQLKYNHINY